MKNYSITNIAGQKYIFFTGKGGVGKTSIASATAIALAHTGKTVLLISTDPASNLQDVFQRDISQHGTTITEVPGLTVVNLDPIKAAEEYKESVVGPYRGLLPAPAIENMEEQLSGSCTVEIAAFNQFSDFLSGQSVYDKYDYIIFDTAPTGHTLRMLQLPTAWNSFIKTSKHGASCLGQLSGLEQRKDIYRQAVETLADPQKTVLVLVSRPDQSPLREAARSSHELQQLGISNQALVVNGIIEQKDECDPLASEMYELQQEALRRLPHELSALPTYAVPLRPYHIDNLNNLKKLLTYSGGTSIEAPTSLPPYTTLEELIDQLYQQGKRVIFTMGKGGVGKTTLATDIAIGLKKRGADVLLTTTDPANHLDYRLAGLEGITTAHIDEQQVLEEYQAEVRRKAIEAGVADLSYIDEDLRSPCTQEIAVFRAFADIVARADSQTIVIDTAPTGHALLLLDSTQSYDKQIEHSAGDTPQSVRQLLPRLRDSRQTEVIIVTLPEPTPLYEAERLQGDLRRAGIQQKWWVVNQCLSLNDTQNSLLLARRQDESHWIEAANHISDGNLVLLGWKGK